MILWEAASGKPMRTIEEGLSLPVRSLAFSPNGAILVTGGGYSGRGETLLWDLNTPDQKPVLLEPWARWAGHQRGFSPQTADVWRPAVKTKKSSFGTSITATNSSISAMTIRFTVLPLVPAATGWRPPAATKSSKFGMPLTATNFSLSKGHKGSLNTVTFSPDGKTLASCGQDDTIKVWDVDPRGEGRLHFSLASARRGGHTADVTGLAFSPDGKRLVSSSLDKTVKVWNLADRKLVMNLPAHPVALVAGFVANAAPPLPLSPWPAIVDGACDSLRRFSCVACGPDGRYIASACYDGRVMLWDAHTGISLNHLDGSCADTIWSVAFDPDSRFLAAASKDKTVRIWDLDSGRQLHTLQGHANAAVDVAFSPDGKRLASASADHTVKIWDLQTANENLHSVRPHRDRPKCRLPARREVLGYRRR